MFTLLFSSLVSTASATDYQAFYDPAMWTCDGGAYRTVVDDAASDRPTLTGCTPSTNTTQMLYADFMLALSDVVDIGAQPVGTDLLATARAHGITIPTGVTRATVANATPTAGSAAGYLQDRVLELDHACGGEAEAEDIEVACISTGRFKICLECSVSLSGDWGCTITVKPDGDWF